MNDKKERLLSQLNAYRTPIGQGIHQEHYGVIGQLQSIQHFLQHVLRSLYTSLLSLKLRKVWPKGLQLQDKHCHYFQEATRYQNTLCAGLGGWSGSSDCKSATLARVTGPRVPKYILDFVNRCLEL